MDWKTILLAHGGRINRKIFWTGVAILVVASLVLGSLPGVGTVLSLALLYPWTCLLIKRLHDFGRSGLLVMVPLLPTAVAALLSVWITFAASFSGSSAGVFAAAGLAATFGLVAMLIALAFLLWVGLKPGDETDNRYGTPTAASAFPVG